jgi:hypothetical protein
MSDGEQQSGPRPDAGWRRMMTWTLVALIATLVMTAIAVYLVIYFFDRP